MVLGIPFDAGQGHRLPVDIEHPKGAEIDSDWLRKPNVDLPGGFIQHSIVSGIRPDDRGMGVSILGGNGRYPHQYTDKKQP
jgi:hypothetical protein